MGASGSLYRLWSAMCLQPIVICNCTLNVVYSSRLICMKGEIPDPVYRMHSTGVGNLLRRRAELCEADAAGGRTANGMGALLAKRKKFGKLTVLYKTRIEIVYLTTRSLFLSNVIWGQNCHVSLQVGSEGVREFWCHVRGCIVCPACHMLPTPGSVHHATQ